MGEMAIVESEHLHSLRDKIEHWQRQVAMTDSEILAAYCNLYREASQISLIEARVEYADRIRSASRVIKFPS